MTKINPFITSGYLSPAYFCDRVTETDTLWRYLTNGNHVALISPRRLGKTGLIAHVPTLTPLSYRKDTPPSYLKSNSCQRTPYNELNIGYEDFLYYICLLY